MKKQTKRPYGTSAKRRSVTITEPDWQALKQHGNGNASAGIRKLLAGELVGKLREGEMV